MSQRFKYTSVDRVFAMLHSLGISTDNESDFIEWIGAALEAIGAIKAYEEAVCFRTVENYRCVLPKNFHNIIQIARNNVYVPANPVTAITANDIAVGITEDTGPSIPVALDENGTPIHEYELAYYRPFFDLQYDYHGWTNLSIYRKCFTPVRLAEHTFFDTLVCREENTPNIYNGTGEDEYTIKAGKTLSFSFEKGQVAIAYNRQPLCKDTGYPMIPDDISYTTACVNYCLKNVFMREFYSGKEGAQMKMEKAETDWVWYCAQAGNKALMLNGIDEHENFTRQRTYLIPPRHSYYGFFGKQYNTKFR